MESVALILILFSQITSAEFYNTCEHYFNPDATSCPTIFMHAIVESLCCGEQPGTKLHCAHGYNNDMAKTQFICYGCFPDSLIPKGFAMSLPCNGTAPSPVPCKEGVYQPEDQNSSSVRYQYCTKEKSRCTAPGEKLWYKGGTTANDACICTQGFQPSNWPDSKDCAKPFTDNDMCSCIHAPCPPGTTRNILYSSMMARKDVIIDYNCIVITSQTTTTSSVTVAAEQATSPHATTMETTSSVTKAVDPATSPPGTTIETSQNSSPDLWYLALIALIMFIILLCYKLGSILVLWLNHSESACFKKKESNLKN